VNLLEAMRIYVRVVERGSISMAAQDLGIGGPAVSERIDRLEKHLGCRLLLRHARAFTCTSEGQRFYERSRAILDAAETAVAEVAGDEQIYRGTIRIAASQCFGETIVPDALKRMRASFPQLEIDLVLNDKVVDLVTEGVDLSFRLGALGSGAYIAHWLGQVDRLLVAAPTYLDRNSPILSAADLVRHPFIRLKSVFAGERLPIERGSSAIELCTIATAMTSSHWRPVYDMIASGLGIGVVEGPACAAALEDETLVRVLPDYAIPSYDVNLLIQAQRPIPPRVTTVVSLLRQFVPTMLDNVRIAGLSRV
jgi:DNA-binding transcriptional LysR family regulator